MDPEVLKRLNVIDLSLSPAALEEQLLEEVLCSERREILKHRQALQLGVLQLEAKLEATEEELVELISQPQRSLLEEENFMPMVRLLQTQIQAVRATRQHMISLYLHQVMLCNKYRPVAHLGVALHQALLQVGRLHPLYHFPTDLCIKRVRQALVSAKHPDLGKQESLEVRLLELCRAVLQHLLAQALPSLREMDRLLFLFLGALATLQVAGDVSPVERLAFFQGFQEPRAKELLQPQASVLRPGWVSSQAWEECRLLESLPGFQGLLASLAGRATQWQEYFCLPSTVVGPALCPSHDHLSPFQRAILWRIMCPEAASSVIADLTTCLLGWSPTEDAVTAHAYSCSRASRPVIFLTPPAGSSGSFTPPLHWIQQMAQQRGRGGKVAVISFGTSDAGKRVRQLLPFCAKRGKWLALNNCHLQKQWDPEVLAQLEVLLNPQAGDPEGRTLEIHTKFRLWLVTAADAPASLPGPVRRSGVILFCEMPLELKGILGHAHQLLQGQVQGLDTDQRLALLALYAALLYRQAYGQWTQAASYLWSQLELWEGFKAQDRLSCLKDGPTEAEALQELAGNIPYGGHILDQGDAEAIRSLIHQCLAADSQESPSPGFPDLLAALRGCLRPELSEEEAAAAIQACIAQLPSPMEPAWVGLCNSLQKELLASRSQAMLAALQTTQGLWQPRRSPSSQKAAIEELVGQGLELLQELVGKLQKCGWEVGARGHPPKGQPRPKPRPLQRFLLEEGGSFLALLQQVQRDLQCGQEHLQGPPCSSPRCAAVLQELQQGRVPRQWLQHTPTGPQPPQAWLETLRCRCKLLCHYLRAQGGVTYQLAAFHHPQRLFLALLQETARTEKQEMERYSLEQQVLPTMLPPSTGPDKGLYLSGLELHHAFWDTHSSQLQETPVDQPCQLPTVWVQATFKPWNAPSCEPTYRCPVFLGAPNVPVPLSSQQAIMHLSLPCKPGPEPFLQRRVYAVSCVHVAPQEEHPVQRNTSGCTR